MEIEKKFSWRLKKKFINYFAKNTFSVSEGALFNTLKLCSTKWKLHADVYVLYSKNYLFVTTSVFCVGDAELFQNPSKTPLSIVPNQIVSIAYNEE